MSNLDVLPDRVLTEELSAHGKTDLGVLALVDYPLQKLQELMTGLYELHIREHPQYSRLQNKVAGCNAHNNCLTLASRWLR